MIFISLQHLSSSEQHNSELIIQQLFTSDSLGNVLINHKWFEHSFLLQVNGRYILYDISLCIGNFNSFYTQHNIITSSGTQFSPSPTSCFFWVLAECRNGYSHKKIIFLTERDQNAIKHVKNTKNYFMKKIAFLAWFHLLERRNAGTSIIIQKIIFWQKLFKMSWNM